MSVKGKHIFINCPFDEAYRPFLQAMVFVIHDCGYFARCALQIDDGGVPRLDKICALIEACRGSVHDLSRMELDPNTKLPRFNMPLELGIFLGVRHANPSVKRMCLVLDAKPRRYRDSCSDLAGTDPKIHEGKVTGLIAAVRDWLRNETPPRIRIPGKKNMILRFQRFRADLPALARTLGVSPDERNFTDMQNTIIEWLKRHPMRKS